MRAWRLDWTRMPCRASTSRIATSAVDAPVAMLRVYCSCPGVSARMNLRLAVAKYRYATSMVMPCSRSALSPSVKREKSIGPAVRFLDAFSTDCTWSSYTPRES